MSDWIDDWPTLEDPSFQLQALVEDPVRMARLHEVEQMIVRDLVNLPYHQHCAGCQRWAARLLAKANGEDGGPSLLEVLHSMKSLKDPT